MSNDATIKQRYCAAALAKACQVRANKLASGPAAEGAHLGGPQGNLAVARLVVLGCAEAVYLTVVAVLQNKVVVFKP